MHRNGGYKKYGRGDKRYEKNRNIMYMKCGIKGKAVGVTREVMWKAGKCLRESELWGPTFYWRN